MVLSFDDTDSMNNTCTAIFDEGDSDTEKDFIIEAMQLEQDRLEAKIINPSIKTDIADEKVRDKIILLLDRIENQLEDDEILREVNRKELKTWSDCLNQFCTKQDITSEEKDDCVVIINKLDTQLIDMYLRV